MSETIIRKLFESRLKTFADAIDLPVGFENQNFEPPSRADSRDNTYLKAFLLPANTVDAFLEGGHKAFIGLFQVSIYTALGIGSATALAVVDQLRALFPTNLVLTDTGGLRVQVSTPLSLGPGIVVQSSFLLPTSFRYRSDVTS